MFPPFDKLVEAEFEQNCRQLADAGFDDAEILMRCLTRLHEASERFEHARDETDAHSVPPWFKTLKRILLEAPFPAAVLDAVDRFVRRSPASDHAFRLFEETPRSLEVLARLSCGSPFLTQVLLSQPEALRELTTERRTADMKSRENFVEEAEALVAQQQGSDAQLNTLREYQRREILRIGMCDAFGLLDLKFVTLQISLLADAMVRICLRIACDTLNVPEPPFAVVALGKHGGEELNYSSDIDLILIGQSATPEAQRVAHRLIEGLSRKMPTGFLYRVDMRLRPWGDAGPLVSTPDTYEAYLKSDGQLWEKQALLKARVIAGDQVVGDELLNRLPPLLFSASKEQILASVRKMKGRIETRLQQKGKLTSEVKLGAGSIRDIEFFVQALQLINGKQEPRIASANTLDALVRLAEFGVLDVTVYRQLREGYIFLRTIEHALQLLHNQQTHELPTDPEQREWLARRMDYPTERELLDRFAEHRRAVRRIFENQFRPVSEQQAKYESPESSTNATVLERSNASGMTDAAAGTKDFDTDQTEQVTTSTEHPDSVGTSQLDEYFRNHADDHEQIREAGFHDIATGSVCRVFMEPVDRDSTRRLVTIVAVEVTGLTSTLCGLFFTNCLDIREGETINGGGHSRFGHVVPPERFLGVFLCEDTSQTQSDQTPGEAWRSTGTVTASAFQDQLARLLEMFLARQESQAREVVLDLFCQRLEELKPITRTQTDLSVVVTQDHEAKQTALTIAADDSLGFFFELSNALSICGFRIQRAELGAHDGRIHDVIYVTEATGGAVEEPERIEELRTAVTLIKQFTDWLPTNSDPHSALIRFRDLLQVLLRKSQWESRVVNLSNPDVLRTVAQVLGMSRYLWEDFLQVRSELLLPLLTDPQLLQQKIARSDLSSRLTQALDQADNGQQARALNTFKDHHLFRIDLRHLLGHCGAFGSFSEEITELAEIVIGAACQLAWDSLQEVHGVPRLSDGRICAYAIAGLGKFGGVEMGYASDIEMFTVYEADCRTDGRSQLSAGSFFERLTGRVSELIRSRRQGIFEIDLRMRPYGQAGSPAVSLDAFRQYYSATGDAWPYERQSLVKLRCIGNSDEFCDQLREACHAVTYGDDSGFDFDAMRAMREKQVRQLVRGGTVNAKLSDGGLVDCEYAVQALQLTFGRHYPRLRTPNTLAAMTGAFECELLPQVEYDSARSAYMFLRELIDCLRMARGNAQDLTIPPADSAEYRQLAARMEAVHDSPLPLRELNAQMAAVRQFSTFVQNTCRRA